MRSILAAALAFVALSTVAEARPRGLAPECGVTMPCYNTDAESDRVRYAPRREGRAPVQGVKPGGCPARRWCGCYLGHYLGIPRRDLWLARNWAGVGRRAAGPAPGVIAVWPHHVGVVKDVEGNRILVHSGNDGNAVRTRWRTTAGVIAWRVL